jgi:putative endonuclease
MTEKHKDLGRMGEAIAAKYLMKKGLHFLERNYHAQGGEIDLVFQDLKTLEYIFVEVKTRQNNTFGDAAESITRGKLKKIVSAGTDYFYKKLKKEVEPFRIDVVLLRMEGGKIFCEHIENVGFEDLDW